MYYNLLSHLFSWFNVNNIKVYYTLNITWLLASSQIIRELLWQLVLLVLVSYTRIFLSLLLQVLIVVFPPRREDTDCWSCCLGSRPLIREWPLYKGILFLMAAAAAQSAMSDAMRNTNPLTIRCCHTEHSIQFIVAQSHNKLYDIELISALLPNITWLCDCHYFIRNLFKTVPCDWWPQQHNIYFVLSQSI